jgi:alpha-D-xyloside xylohydrolase
VSSADDSFMRALFMDFPQDRNVWELGSEFMFGRSLLVAPVGKALFTEETRRYSDAPVDWNVPQTYDVYLPAGVEWYDWWTGERLKGGRTVSAAAPLDRCPLYARAGAIVPLGPDDVQYCDEKPWDELDVRVYLGADGRFTLYEDAFDGQEYKSGEYTTIDFSLKGRNLSIGTRRGEYPGMLESRRFHLLVYDGRKVSEQYVLYTGNPLTIKL